MVCNRFMKKQFPVCATTKNMMSLLEHKVAKKNEKTVKQLSFKQNHGNQVKLKIMARLL